MYTVLEIKLTENLTATCIINETYLQEAIDYIQDNNDKNITTSMEFIEEKFDARFVNVTTVELCEKDPCGDCIYYGDCKENPEDCIYSEAYKQQEGVCPICGATDLEYDSIEPDGCSITYPWTCLKCRVTGEELYELTFVQHINIETEG